MNKLKLLGADKEHLFELLIDVPEPPIKGKCEKQPVPGCYDYAASCVCAKEWRPYEQALKQCEDTAIPIDNEDVTLLPFLIDAAVIKRTGKWTYLDNRTHELKPGDTFDLPDELDFKIEHKPCDSDECLTVPEEKTLTFNPENGELIDKRLLPHVTDNILSRLMQENPVLPTNGWTENRKADIKVGIEHSFRTFNKLYKTQKIARLYKKESITKTMIKDEIPQFGSGQSNTYTSTGNTPSMEEYSNQQLSEFKEKLKKERPLREHFEIDTDAGNTLRTFDYINALEKFIDSIKL